MILMDTQGGWIPWLLCLLSPRFSQTVPPNLSRSFCVSTSDRGRRWLGEVYPGTLVIFPSLGQSV